MRMLVRLLVVLALWSVCLQGGCGRSTQQTSGGAEDPSPAAGVPAEAPRAEANQIDFGGYGPARVGMTVAEAERALGDTIEVSASAPGSFCLNATAKHQPGVAFMLVDGRIARVDARDSSVRTTEGARVGDSEERIHELYGGNVEVQPHKYVDGHYLIVRPRAGSDSTRRLIFETDGKRVTTYRGGRTPEVGWIEGCS